MIMYAHTREWLSEICRLQESFWMSVFYQGFFKKIKTVYSKDTYGKKMTIVYLFLLHLNIVSLSFLLLFDIMLWAVCIFHMGQCSFLGPPLVSSGFYHGMPGEIILPLCICNSEDERNRDNKLLLRHSWKAQYSSCIKLLVNEYKLFRAIALQSVVLFLVLLLHWPLLVVIGAIQHELNSQREGHFFDCLFIKSKQPLLST